jgi:antitoxin HicB
VRSAYPVTLERDEVGRFVAFFPDVPEALTDGADEAAALNEARDALRVALAGYVHARRPLPRPSRRKGPIVALPPLVAVKLALYQAIRAQAVTNVALAERLGITEGAVRRLVDPDHASRMEKLEAALEALGVGVVLEDVA